MDRFVEKIAVVTGTSAGSGEAIAKELLKYGVHVAGLARRIEKLEELCKEVKDTSIYKGKFYPIQCDVTKKEEIKSAFNYVFENLGPIHILINNAAVLEATYLTDAKPEMVEGSFDVNVKGVIMCTTQAVRNMRENKTEGHIINMNSVMGHTAFSIKPNIYMLYASTKQALRVISEGLRREMIEKKLNIKVTNLSPGYVKSEMTKGLTLPEGFEKNVLVPEDVAKACIICLDTPPKVVVSELTLLPMHMKF